MIPALCTGVFHRNEKAFQIGTVWRERNEEINTLFVYHDSLYTPKMGRTPMPSAEDALLLSFYYISQSSQEIPYQDGIEDHQGGVAKPKKETGAGPGVEFILNDAHYGIPGKGNPKAQNEPL